MLGALGSPLDTESITVKWSIVVIPGGLRFTEHFL